MGPVSPEERRSVIGASPLGARYDQPVDRESAYEVLKKRADEELARHEAAQKQEAAEAAAPAAPSAPASGRSRSRSRRQTPVEALMTSAMRAVGSQIGRQIVRGLLGSFLKR
jgi:hypothetical protein